MYSTVTLFTQYQDSSFVVATKFNKKMKAKSFHTNIKMVSSTPFSSVEELWLTGIHIEEACRLFQLAESQGGSCNPSPDSPALLVRIPTHQKLACCFQCLQPE